MKPLWVNDYEIRESRFFPLDVRGEERSPNCTNGRLLSWIPSIRDGITVQGLSDVCYEIGWMRLHNPY